MINISLKITAVLGFIRLSGLWNLEDLLDTDVALKFPESTGLLNGKAWCKNPAKGNTLHFAEQHKTIKFQLQANCLFNICDMPVKFLSIFNYKGTVSLFFSFKKLN